MFKRFFGSPGPGDDLHSFLKAAVRFLHGDIQPVELAPLVTATYAQV
jgi:hypothetical protein